MGLIWVAAHPSQPNYYFWRFNMATINAHMPTMTIPANNTHFGLTGHDSRKFSNMIHSGPALSSSIRRRLKWIPSSGSPVGQR